jgi:hypothetical protein
MEIKTIEDIKAVSNMMHDAEFEDSDFGFNSVESKFFLNASAVTMQGSFFQTRAPIQSGKHFSLELLNVKKYTPINLEKVRAGKAIGGVFNYIKVEKRGMKLTIISQDLHIELELGDIAGTLEEIPR